VLHIYIYIYIYIYDISSLKVKLWPYDATDTSSCITLNFIFRACTSRKPRRIHRSVQYKYFRRRIFSRQIVKKCSDFCGQRRTRGDDLSRILLQNLAGGADENQVASERAAGNSAKIRIRNSIWNSRLHLENRSIVLQKSILWGVPDRITGHCRIF